MEKYREFVPKLYWTEEQIRDNEKAKKLKNDKKTDNKKGEIK